MKKQRRPPQHRWLSRPYLRRFRRHVFESENLDLFSPFEQEYLLALYILQHFFGQEWIETHVNFDTAEEGFLKQPGKGDEEARVRHRYRVIFLSEMLFNLQHSPGFYDRLDKLNGGQIESTYAELETARCLRFWGIPFRLVKPSGKKKLDYDIEVRISDDVWIPADTKSKLTGRALEEKGLLESLRTARAQLPDDRPSCIFLRIPDTILVPTPKLIDGAVMRFFGQTKTIASVKVHSSPSVLTPWGEAYSNLLFQQFDNPRCEFSSPVGWGVFPAQSGAQKPDSLNTPEWMNLRSFLKELPT